MRTHTFGVTPSALVDMEHRECCKVEPPNELFPEQQD